jgi:hypothetical protein
MREIACAEMTWMGALRSVMTRKNENKKLEGTHG